MNKNVVKPITGKFKGISLGFAMGFAVGLSGFLILELTFGNGIDVESLINMLIVGTISGIPTLIPTLSS